MWPRPGRVHVTLLEWLNKPTHENNGDSCLMFVQAAAIGAMFGFVAHGVLRSITG